MVRRPAKKWWDDCTKGVKKSGSAYSPQQVCGDLWFNKMSEEQRKKAVRESERYKRKHKSKYKSKHY